MAPKRSSGKSAKSVPDASRKNGTKRIKVGDACPEDDLLDTVAAALHHATDVSATSCEMLRCMGQGCFRTPASARHPYQAAVVDMFQEVLVSADASMQQDIKDSTLRIDSGRNLVESCQEALHKRRQEVNVRCKELEEEMKYFCSNNVALQDAYREYDAASGLLSRTSCAISEAEQLKSTLESALDKHFRPLLEGSSADPQNDLEVLRPLLGKIAVEESLDSAFVVAAKMKPEARGIFDKAAMTQLQAEFVKHAAKLGQTVAAKMQETSLQAAKEAAGVAEGILAEARKRQRENATQLRLAEVKHHEAEGARGGACKEVREAGEALRLAEAQQATLEHTLDAFRRGPMAAFEALLVRDDCAERSAGSTWAGAEGASHAEKPLSVAPSPGIAQTADHGLLMESMAKTCVREASSPGPVAAVATPARAATS